jgi:hypothetical protein
MNQIDDYIQNQEPPAMEILKKLNSILLSCASQMEVRLTYNIPFYYYFGRLYYLNPKDIGVDLGFCRGALLSDHPLLGRKELKEVRIIHFESLQKITKEELQPIIFEAIILNELMKKGRK